MIDVKTLVTFALVGATIAFAALNKVDAKEVSSMALMAVSLLLGVKATQGIESK